MEDRCEYCGLPLGDPYQPRRPRWNAYCDGVLTLGTDPFAEEIRGDYTEYWQCHGERVQSAMEI